MRLLFSSFLYTACAVLLILPCCMGCKAFEEKNWFNLPCYSSNFIIFKAGLSILKTKCECMRYYVCSILLNTCSCDVMHIDIHFHDSSNKWMVFYLIGCQFFRWLNITLAYSIYVHTYIDL